jgi:hypothetical protein
LGGSGDSPERNYHYSNKNDLKLVGFEVLTAVVMNVAIFWDIAPCSPYVNQRFGGTYHLYLQGKKSAEQETSVQQGG